ncbi:MAG: DUF429 domain-containing protein [Candidatus Hadarchaeota archaeon]|nr:DUF429 domain-containing protein [Candidatus Hadarchaeota archaeon]
MKAIGIDLAGKEPNPSGFAVLLNYEIKTRLVYPDEEILQLCTHERPDIVAIDAPLSFPREGNLRSADAQLIHHGYRVLPPTFGGMRALTGRGIQLAKKLRARSVRIIEIHPRTSGRILFGTPNREEWLLKLEREGWEVRGGTSDHEVDAAIATLTGLLYLSKKTEEVGEPEEGKIVIPRDRM